MKLSTDGLIIGEQNIGEQDRLVTVLTQKRGVIRAFVKNCRSLKSAKGSSTRLLCYSRLTLYVNRDTYIVDEAVCQEMFISLRTDITAMSLAQYFCELFGYLAPKETGADEYLKLILNALYLLSRKKRPDGIIKTATELRLMCFCGYMPDLVCCSNCKCYESKRMFFLPKSGKLLCGDCIEQSDEYSIEVGMGVTTAMRFCIYAEFSKMFNFKLSPEGTELLERCCEEYIAFITEHNFKTLEFYKTIR